MATNIMSLFNTEDSFAPQQQAFQQRLMQATDPRAFIAAVGGNMGAQLGQAVPGLLGMPNKQQKVRRIMQAVGSISDPLGQAKEAYKLFQQEGMPQEAQAVLQNIQELQKESDTLKQTADLANVDFSSSAAVQQAAQAALRSGDRAGGVALLKEARQLKKAEEEAAKRKTLVESRAAGIARNNPDIPAEVVPLIAGDDDIFKEWSKTLFEAKKNNYDLSYQTFNGERVMRLVDKDTGNLVKEVVLGQAAQTGTNVEINTGDMQTAGEKSKGTVLGKGVGEDLLKTRLAAQTANENLPKMYTALNILKTQPITTGLGYQFYDIINQVRAQYLSDKKAGVEVTNSQYLDSLVGGAVFNAIADLGIGARGIDTPKEKDFLLEVVTGKRSLSENALIQITEMRIESTEKSVKKFNDYLSKGDYKDLETILGRKLNPIQLRSANQAPTSSNW
jgi:tellurite resistance protein